MFEEFTKSDLTFFGPLLLEKAELKKTRKENVKKINVPRVEEIMADIKVKVK